MVKVPDNLFNNFISKDIDGFVKTDIKLINLSYNIDYSIGDTIFRNTLENFILYLKSHKITNTKEQLEFINEYKLKIESNINPTFKSNISKIIISL